MSALTIIFNRNGAPIEGTELGLMVGARQERSPDGWNSWTSDQVMLGNQHFWLTPEEVGENQPLTSASCTITCDARVDNRHELIHKLDLDPIEAKHMTDADLIMLCYQAWGPECLQHLRGDFAFAIWDVDQRHLFLARDALGARDICYFFDHKRFLAASEISQILAHPAVEVELNENKIAARLGHLWDTQEETYYKNIYYLPPAHGLIVTEESTRMWRYWDINPQKQILYNDIQEYAEHYKSLLEESIRQRLRAIGSVAISLSGGLDSSALAAIAAPMIASSTSKQDHLISYSYVFDKLRSCDERKYIEPIVERYDLEAEYLLCDDKWTLKDLDNWPSSRDTVYADPYILLPAAVLGAAQKRGVRLLLAGYFGDTLFAGGRYWALDMMRSMRIGTLLQTFASNHQDINWRRAIYEDGLRQLIPERAAELVRRWRPREVQSHHSSIHPKLLARTDLMERQSVKMKKGNFSNLGQAFRYQALTLSVFSQGLAVSRHWYNQHGLELVMPYYNRELVEFVMAVPAYELGRPDEERRIHRRAVKNIVPEAILNRNGYTSFIALRNKGLNYKERDTVQKILINPLIVERGYIDPSWLNNQKQKDFDLSLDSAMLWTAISLELWLKRYWS